MYVLNKISPSIQKTFKNFAALNYKPTPWANDIDKLLHEANIPQDEKTIFSLIHKKQQIEMIFNALLENELYVFEEVKKGTFKNWENFKTCPADISLQKTLGQKIFNGDPDHGNKPFIRASEYSQEVSYEIFRQTTSQGLDFNLYIEEDQFLSYLKSHATEEGNFNLGTYVGDFYLNCNRAIAALSGVAQKPGQIYTPNKKQKSAYTEGVKEGRSQSLKGLFYTLTVIPTHQDAINADIPYDDFTKIFFEMCDQPDKQIETAQAKLIEKFDMAKKLHIKNDDGTDISMDLYDKKGAFTFANSVTAKNLPGSEFFSAPAKYSVNGKIVAKGRFIGDLNDYDIIQDITLNFKDGRINSYDASEGLETLAKNIEYDEGTHYLGEIAFGTNAACQKHVANSLMCEKIGGSFHVAIGNAFKYNSYCGKPVRLDNGNVSKEGFHWDVTTMLKGKGGYIALDGKAIMKEGLWVGNEFDILNKGWQAIPFEERPTYWQEKFPKHS